jgi:hypothetical protein
MALDRDSKVWPEDLTAPRKLSVSALKPSRLLTYIAFAVAFGGIAYLLIFKRRQWNEWVELHCLFCDSLWLV